MAARNPGTALKRNMSKDEILFILDFDGTVTRSDVVDDLLERFADPEWRKIESLWVSGAISSHECMARQIALLRPEREAIEQFLQSVEIDPSFPDFVSFASQFAQLLIVSDGIDYPIAHTLRRLRLNLPFFANSLEFADGRWRLRFPHQDTACIVNSGVCKCMVARKFSPASAPKTVLIGDGRSDYCIARNADFIFAKASLRRFCEQEAIPCVPFDSFADVLRVIRRWRASEEEPLPESQCPLWIATT